MAFRGGKLDHGPQGFDVQVIEPDALFEELAGLNGISALLGDAGQPQRHDTANLGVKRGLVECALVDAGTVLHGLGAAGKQVNVFHLGDEVSGIGGDDAAQGFFFQVGISTGAHRFGERFEQMLVAGIQARGILKQDRGLAGGGTSGEMGIAKRIAGLVGQEARDVGLAVGGTLHRCGGRRRRRRRVRQPGRPQPPG